MYNLCDIESILVQDSHLNSAMNMCVFQIYFLFKNYVSTYMRREFHRLVLVPRDIRVWINPSFQDSVMLLLKTLHPNKYEFDVNFGVF
jgi:hypothetical protein